VPLFGPPNVEKLRARNNAKGLIRALQHRNDRVRMSAASELADLGTHLDRPALRTHALEAVCAAAFEDRTRSVRLEAALALGRAARKVQDEWFARRAAEALINVWPSRPYGAYRSDESERIIHALKFIGAPAVEPLGAALNAPEHESWHQQIVAILLAIGDTKAVGPLLKRLRTGSPGIRTRSAEALVAISKQTEAVELRQRVVRALITCLRDGNADVRQAAAHALGQFSDTRAVLPLTVAARDTETGVRLAAVNALGRIDDVQVLGPLDHALNDEDPEVRAAAVVGLGKTGSSRVVGSLMHILKDKSSSPLYHC
jgi:HEAT repeat protein